MNINKVTSAFALSLALAGFTAPVKAADADIQTFEKKHKKKLQVLAAALDAAIVAGITSQVVDDATLNAAVDDNVFKKYTKTAGRGTKSAAKWLNPCEYNGLPKKAAIGSLDALILAIAADVNAAAFFEQELLSRKLINNVTTK